MTMIHMVQTYKMKKIGQKNLTLQRPKRPIFHYLLNLILRTSQNWALVCCLLRPIAMYLAWFGSLVSTCMVTIQHWVFYFTKWPWFGPKLKSKSKFSIMIAEFFFPDIILYPHMYPVGHLADLISDPLKFFIFYTVEIVPTKFWNDFPSYPHLRISCCTFCT